MPRIDLYLSDDEKEYVKAKGPGFVRGLVQEHMNPPVRPAKPERENRAVICPKCGLGLSFPGQNHTCVVPK